MNIQLHIERLILDGVALQNGQGAQLQAAVEAELARLLLAGGLNAELRAGGALPWLRGGDIQLTGDGSRASDSMPAQLGQQIAQAVHRGIGAPSERQTHAKG